MKRKRILLHTAVLVGNSTVGSVPNKYLAQQQEARELKVHVKMDKFARFNSLFKD